MRSVPDRAVLASRYRLVRELGRGGMGAVYLAEHLRTGEHVAVKILLGHAASDSHAVERFKREARASARIKSDHVVRVIDADVAPEIDDTPFLVMELLDGGDLGALLDQRGKLSPAEVVSLLTQAARALDKSHAIGIIHRDLKPENLFIHRREDGSEILKVVDFGISKMLNPDALPDSSKVGVTNSGAMVGTPLYMSPEQAKGSLSEIGPATDVWAVGLIAIRLLTGERYWRAESVAELMVEMLSGTMYPPSTRWPNLSPEVDAWFAKSCARDAKARWKSVGEQIAALAGALGLPSEVLAQSPRIAIGSTPVSQISPRASEPSPVGDSFANAPTASFEAGDRIDAARVQTPNSISTSAARGLRPSERPRSRRAGLVGLLAVVGIGGAIAAVVVLSRGAGDESARARGGGSERVTTAPSAFTAKLAAASTGEPTPSPAPPSSSMSPSPSAAPSAIASVTAARPVTRPAPRPSATASAAPSAKPAASPDPRSYAPTTL